MADTIEVRLARLEGSYEQVSERLGSIEGRLDGIDSKLTSHISDTHKRLDDLRAETHNGLSELQREMYSGFDSLRAEMHASSDKLRAEMRTQFYWLLGVIIVAFLVPVVLGIVF